MKYISIIGDSISTYEGYNPLGYDVFYEEFNCKMNGIASVEDTWWVKVIHSLNGKICVNNSYSGSRVSGESFPSANCEQRIFGLHTKESVPDIILVYIGYNDFGNKVKIISSGLNERGFFESYSNMIMAIKKNYPNSRIVCGTLMQSILCWEDWAVPHRLGGISIYEYNAAIKIAAKLAGAELADIAALELRYESSDGSHPNKRGHETIAKAWISCLEQL